MKKLLAIIILAVSGCATTHFSETVTDPATGRVDTTVYTGRSIVPPFGKGPDSVHSMAYAWGGENSITIGQDATGLDASGQIEAAKVIGEIVLKIAVEAAKAYIAGVPVSAPETVFSP